MKGLGPSPYPSSDKGEDKKAEYAKPVDLRRTDSLDGQIFTL